MYYIYILYSTVADKYYVGHSLDPWSRLKQHLSNSGDKYTGSYKDWKLVGVFEVSANKGDADKVEKFIKRQKSRILIEKILEENFIGTGEGAKGRTRMWGFLYLHAFGNFIFRQNKPN